MATAEKQQVLFVVDDDHSQRELINTFGAKLDLQVILAASFDAANAQLLELMEHLVENPLLAVTILVDQKMPINGQNSIDWIIEVKKFFGDTVDVKGMSSARPETEFLDAIGGYDNFIPKDKMLPTLMKQTQKA